MKRHELDAYFCSYLLGRVSLTQCTRVWRLQSVEVDCDSERNRDGVGSRVTTTNRAARRIDAVRDVPQTQHVRYKNKQ